MKELVIYYSFGGKTRTLAERLAQQRDADLYEVVFQKNPSLVRAFFLCPAAMGHKRAKVQPIDVDFSQYGKITVMGPVWASNPAPPLNNIFAAIPAGTPVEVRLVSSSGSSNRQKTMAFLDQCGLTVTAYEDIKN